LFGIRPFLLSKNILIGGKRMSENSPTPQLEPFDILSEADEILERETAGLYEPGPWGHWYQGSDPAKQAIVAASKAALKARREENKRLNWLCADWELNSCLRGPERTQASLEHIKRMHSGDHWSRR
jgi:hypothetical protein